MPFRFRVLAAAVILAASLVSAAPSLARAFADSADSADSVGSHDQAVITGLIEHYIRCFNSRDAEGILDLYAPEARIRKPGLFASRWIDKREFTPVLQERLAKYDRRGARITGFDVKRLDIEDDRAEVDISVRARQGLFSARRSGSFELTRDTGGWKIVAEES